MSPRTTVIMPAYNTAGTITRAIRSVTNQTDDNFELLIINDASPDNLYDVVQEYLEEHPDDRVRYIENPENLGLAESRNTGMREATGEWIAFLDSDDQYVPSFLETMHNDMWPDTDVVVCGHYLSYETGETTYRRRGDPGTYTGHDAMLRLLRDEITPYAWDKIYRAEKIQGLNFPNINRIEDEAFTVQAFKNARQVEVIDAGLHLYSVNSNSITWATYPPLMDCWRYVAYLKAATNAHEGSEEEKNALAVAWVLCFLNAAQSALRLRPDALHAYLEGCQEALPLPLVIRTMRTAPFFGAAALLLRASPAAYRALYGEYVNRTYHL